MAYFGEGRNEKFEIFTQMDSKPFGLVKIKPLIGEY